MENLKIRVTTEQESKEVQELFFELGYRDRKNWTQRNPAHESIQAWKDGEFTFSLNHNQVPVGFEEITLQELRDMVVLERNDVGDATHTDQDNWKWYIGEKSYCWERVGGNPMSWVEESTDHAELKPIKEEAMKEYLVKTDSGNYLYTKNVSDIAAERVIEIPQGTNVYARCNIFGDYKWLPKIIDGDWSVLWQREKESLNDKIATAEVARQEEKHSHYKKDVSHLKMIDPYRISDLYNLHPCADHIMKKSLCAGNRGHKDMLRDIQDIIDTAERWKQMIKEDNNEI